MEEAVGCREMRSHWCRGLERAEFREGWGPEEERWEVLGSPWYPMGQGLRKARDANSSSVSQQVGQLVEGLSWVHKEKGDFEVGSGPGVGTGFRLR